MAVCLKLCLLGNLLLEPLISVLLQPSDAISSDVLPSAAGQASESRKEPFSSGIAKAAPTPAPETTGKTEPEPSGSLAREALARRQEELARKEEDLRSLERDLNNRLAELQALEVRLQSMLKEAGEVRTEKFRQLIDVLSNMKAKQAAGVLETLDEKIAVKVLSGMRGRQAGEILTFVDAKKAARLAESLSRLQLPFE
jgi:flagellar motility protein MotE (MotC chaperone)